MTHLPYKGTGPALNDLMGGQIALVIAGQLAVIPLMQARRLRGIAVTTLKRSNALPDLPTVAETLPGYEAVQWYAVLGPKALPQPIVNRWNTEIDRILRMPDIKERMSAGGMETAGGPPERVREVLIRDITKWKQVVKAANIRTD